MMKCKWCLGFQAYEDYHDNEWGVPVEDDAIHFEFLVLESAQAGLSWSTILKRRDAYRKAYSNFDVYKVSQYTSDDVERLMQDVGIIRNRRKIESSINNARRFLEIVDEFGSFSHYIWKFVNYRPIDSAYQSMDELPAKNEVSIALSKDLKKRGFKFLGPVIMYAHMQATGLYNDHVLGCDRYKKCKELGQRDFGQL